jgi:arginine decarboxylase
MVLNPDRMPIVEALEFWGQKEVHAPFYTPGHKRGVGANPRLVEAWGSEIWRSDLPELPDLDNLQSPTGIILAAQELAAETFGAEQTWFVVNGSTAGVMAAIMATCGDGDKLILPRNVHQSAVAGLIHTGAVPIWVEPEYDRESDIAHCVTAATINDALSQHPDVRAVFIVAPTYYGAVGDTRSIAALCHERGIPLIVDEAHGAHFHFSPELPPSSLSVGADLVIQSIHKTLGSLTQSAMVHAGGNLIDRSRFSHALRLFQTTSPSYLLLASLDAARQQMATQGRDLMARTIALARRARTEIATIDGLSIVDAPAIPTPGWQFLDLTRVTVTVTGLNITGFTADEILDRELNITAELPSLRHLTFIISIGNTAADIDRLIAGFTHLAAYHRQIEPLSLPPSPAKPSSISAHPALTPRQAFFAHHQTVSLNDAIGRISAESLCPYPPGIPLIMPGETIDDRAIDYLRSILAAGGEITGCTDPELNTFKVVG